MPTQQELLIAKLKKDLTSTVKVSLSDAQKLALTGGGQTNLHSHAGGTGAEWGGISGTLSAQTDLNSALGGKASSSHSHPNDHAPGSDNQDLSGKSDVGHTHSYEPANSNIQAHVISAHAPSGAQVNADITKAEIEAKLTGELTSHTHAGGGGDGEVTIVATQDTPNATVNLANATGLAFTGLANGTYIIEVFLVWAASVATVGIKVSATATNSPTIQAGHFITDAVNGTPDSSSWNANDVVVTTSASPFTTNNIGMVNAILKVAASNSVWQLRFAAETTGQITIKQGSTLRYRKVS